MCFYGVLGAIKGPPRECAGGQLGVREAALGSVGGSGRPNCLLDATLQQNENPQTRAQAVMSEIAGGRMNISLHYGEETK